MDLRLIVLKSGGKTYRALTNDMDPSHLSAEDIVALYPMRWTVERLFFQLKVVLNLRLRRGLDASKCVQLIP